MRQYVCSKKCLTKRLLKSLIYDFHNFAYTHRGWYNSLFRVGWKTQLMERTKDRTNPTRVRSRSCALGLSNCHKILFITLQCIYRGFKILNCTADRIFSKFHFRYLFAVEKRRILNQLTLINICRSCAAKLNLK